MQNRPVIIQNIVGIGDDGEYMEPFFQDPTTTHDPLPRLIEHINFLAGYAEEAHENQLSLDPQEELVTRLTTNEFSLYPQDKPFSLDQYKSLIEAIHKIAKKLPPNIHLLVATVPVLWPDNRLHNVAVHVQSPIVEPI